MEECPCKILPQPLCDPTEITWEALLWPSLPCLLEASRKMARECPSPFPASFRKHGNSEQDSCTLLSVSLNHRVAINPMPNGKKLSSSAYYCLGKLICPLSASCLSLQSPLLPFQARKEPRWRAQGHRDRLWPVLPSHCQGPDLKSQEAPCWFLPLTVALSISWVLYWTQDKPGD